VSPILDIIRSCSDEESLGNINQQTSTTDPNTNKKYIHNLNFLNKNKNMYNNSTEQQDVRMTNNTYGNTRRHFSTNRVQNDTRHSYGNDARCSYANGAGQEYINKTYKQTPLILPKEKVHKTIHHEYDEIKLKLKNTKLTEQDKQRF